MATTQVKLWLRRQTAWGWVRRAVFLIVFTIAFTAVLNRPLPADGSAGFARGIIDGALMPGAMPPLLMGRDVTIYAAQNSGRPYKLGYTVGVNGCGALFFGIIFWRVTRWRRSEPPPKPV